MSADPTGELVKRVPDKRRNSKIDMWGPQDLSPVTGYTTHAPYKRKPWGLVDVLWGVLAIVGASVIALPFLSLLAIATYDIEADSIDAAAQINDGIVKVLTTAPGLLVGLLSTWVAFVGVPLFASYRKGHRSLAKDFGFLFKVTDLPLGLGIALGMQAILAGISWLLNQTSLDLSGADNTGQVTDLVGAALVIAIIGATIGAPLTEELFFRGLVLRASLRKFARLDLAPLLPGVTDSLHDADVSKRRRKWGIVAAVVFSSLFFGAMHAPVPVDESGSVSIGALVLIGQTGLLGLVFALIALKTRRLGMNICAHFFFNSISITLVLVTS